MKTKFSPRRFRDDPACGANGFGRVVTPARSLRHNFHMKKILILTSILLASATAGMFADDLAPMPSVNIPVSPAAATTPAQTPTTSHAKGKHKGKKHKKHAKKTGTKKTDTTTGPNSGTNEGAK